MILVLESTKKGVSLSQLCRMGVERVCIFVIFWLSFFSVGRAQTVFFGAKVGGNANVARFGGSYLSDNGYESQFRLGFQSGVALNYMVDKRWSLHSECLFTRKGMEVSKRGQAFVVNELRMDYVEVPVLFRFSFGGKNLKYYLNAGPNVSYWMRGRGFFHSHLAAEREATRNGYDYAVHFGRYTGDEIEAGLLGNDVQNPHHQRVQWGIDMGGGFWLPVIDPFKAVVLDFRYTLGQSFLGNNPESYNNLTLEKSPLIGMIPSWEAANHSFQASLYFMVGFLSPTSRGYGRGRR